MWPQYMQFWPPYKEHSLLIVCLLKILSEFLLVIIEYFLHVSLLTRFDLYVSLTLSCNEITHRVLLNRLSDYRTCSWILTSPAPTGGNFPGLCWPTTMSSCVHK